jgi:two-component system response regulator FlrC
METLLAYEWPGNVRELMNVIERAVILCPGNQLDPEHFVLDLGDAAPPSKVGETLADREKAWILEVLEREGGNRTRAARRLGVSVRTIRNKLALYSLEGPVPAPPNGYTAGELRRAS